jgi:hypothetical protein
VRLHVRGAHSPWLRNWPVTRRLVAVIVLGVAGALAVGGLRVSSAVSAAAGYARTTQLAVLGEQVTALAQALENERDLTAGFDAASGQDLASASAGSTQARHTQHQVSAYQAAMTQAYLATNVLSRRVSAAAARIDASFPAIAQSRAQAAIGIIGNIAGLRSAAVSQASLDTIQGYDESIASLFALNDEIASGSGDTMLSDGTRTLDALSRAKDQVSQQRAILYAALIDGQYAAGAQQSLITSQALQNAYLLTFESSATNAEVNSYRSTVAGVPVDAAQFLLTYLSTQAGTTGSAAATGKNAGTGTLLQRAGQLGRAYVTGLSQRYYADMSAMIGKMRTVEAQVAQRLVARGQALRTGAAGSAVLTAVVTLAIAAALLFATFLATRSRDGDGHSQVQPSGPASP